MEENRTNEELAEIETIDEEAETFDQQNESTLLPLIMVAGVGYLIGKAIETGVKAIYKPVREWWNNRKRKNKSDFVIVEDEDAN